MASGQVNITIADGGATITIPQQALQVVLGCSSAGTATTASTTNILATSEPGTVQSTYGYGPLVEACGLTIAAGGTVLAIKLPTVVAGEVVSGDAVDIVSSTNANPIVVEATAHGFLTGDVVTIASHLVNTSANGTWRVTKVDADHFSIAVAGVGIGANTGTATWTGAKNTGTGTAAVYFDGAAYDDSFPLVTFTGGGTVGADSMLCTISLDAGRSARLVTVNLGTATSYVIPQTGITMHLVSGKTIVAGDTARCRSTGPLPNAAGITAALGALAASPYGSSGWGSMHLVGTIGGADAATVGAYLETMATTNLIYTRCLGEARDASPPIAWCGTGETDATWSASVVADFASTNVKRLGVTAGHYNITSAYSNPVAGLPLYRRPLAWAHACRIIRLPKAADAESWVALGSLPEVVENTVTDPLDGFVYHDEQNGAVFDATLGGPGRMGAARHHRRRSGWFMSRPLALAATGSTFARLADGRLADLAAGIIQQVLTPDIDARVKVNANGTILEKSAGLIESDCYQGLDSQIGDQYSGRTVVVNRTWDVKANNSLKILGTIVRDGRIEQIDFTLNLA